MRVSQLVAGACAAGLCNPADTKATEQVDDAAGRQLVGGARRYSCDDVITPAWHWPTLRRNMAEVVRAAKKGAHELAVAYMQYLAPKMAIFNFVGRHDDESALMEEPCQLGIIALQFLTLVFMDKDTRDSHFTHESGFAARYWPFVCGLSWWEVAASGWGFILFGALGILGRDSAPDVADPEAGVAASSALDAAATKDWLGASQWLAVARDVICSHETHFQTMLVQHGLTFGFLMDVAEEIQSNALEGDDSQGARPPGEAAKADHDCYRDCPLGTTLTSSCQCEGLFGSRAVGNVAEPTVCIFMAPRA
eukprot:TRINITY_DN30673_c0_g1_i2.p1 TRINITY_DN30673_c0_g1~~TRINITY_DN30673_c0_g1_i2.p1  ORF type:complete len:308 (+),score=62.19 TRINITY_DN30673_c0_g1_i2:101-1024(+)